MIVKMKFLSITGPKLDIDRAIDRYLSKYEIQLENAAMEFKNVRDLRSNTENFTCKEEMSKAADYLHTLNIDVNSLPELTEIANQEEAVHTIHTVDQSFVNIKQKKLELEEQIRKLDDSIDHIKNYTELNFDVDAIFQFKYIKYRFGRFSKEYYEKFTKYIDDDLDVIFCKCHTSDDYVWGVYFVPSLISDRIDAVFTSLHFERMHLDHAFVGTPKEALQTLIHQKADLQKEHNTLSQKEETLLETNKQQIIKAYQIFTKLNMYCEAKKYAAYLKKEEHEQFILCGWMAEEDAYKLADEIKPDPDFYCLFEDDEEKLFTNPPTKLKNPKLFKPFELFTKMYGLPNYKEFDPTILLAITYSFIFGAMFGDVGQGLVLLVGGLLLYRYKKMALAACISCCGVFSTFFGFMFGSIFGFEDIIEPVWLRPMDHMSKLPFIGQLNTVFVVAIAFGMFMILVSMILQIVNGIRMHNITGTYFDANGVAGLVFYGTIVGVIVLFMTGHKVAGGILLALLLILPIICMAFKEQLTKLVEKSPDVLPKGIGMFIVTTFFELFEVLLSYFSNTLSYVRIGAFAVSHAAMMQVVLMLAGAENGGTGNILTLIIGNIVVCAMEGLVVGIQVLRLEYYEMFSRYYHGDGTEFKPFLTIKNN